MCFSEFTCELQEYWAWLRHLSQGAVLKKRFVKAFVLKLHWECYLNESRWNNYDSAACTGFTSPHKVKRLKIIQVFAVYKAVKHNRASTEVADCLESTGTEM
jgi:hypothetical protein